MKKELWLSVALAVGLLLACQENDENSPPLDDLSRAGHQTNDETPGAAGDGGLPSPVAGGAGSGGDGAVDCSTVEDEAGESMTIRVTNDTTETLYLGDEVSTCSPNEPWRFELRDGDGRQLAAIGSCQRCRSAIVTGTGDCPSFCRPRTTLKLDPGEHTDLTWDGLFETSVPLPEACILPGAAPIHSAECRRANRVEGGVYSFAVRAGSTLSCGEECEPCRPLESGGCETSAALVDRLDLEARVDVELASGPGYGVEGPIELIFRD